MSVEGAYNYLENLSTQELEDTVKRNNLQVRRGTFKEATYRRLLINKLKSVTFSNLGMNTEQLRHSTSEHGKKCGDKIWRNMSIMSI
jgi:hypothetical protein